MPEPKEAEPIASARPAAGFYGAKRWLSRLYRSVEGDSRASHSPRTSCKVVRPARLTSVIFRLGVVARGAGVEHGMRAGIGLERRRRARAKIPRRHDLQVGKQGTIACADVQRSRHEMGSGEGSCTRKQRRTFLRSNESSGYRGVRKAETCTDPQSGCSLRGESLVVFRSRPAIRI